MGYSRIFSVLLIFFLLLSALPVLAQDGTGLPEGDPEDTSPISPDLAAAVREAEEAAENARREADNASRAAGDASNFLQLFEGISLVITVVIGGVGAFGILRFIRAENELTRTAAQVKADLQQARDDLTADLEDAKMRFSEQLAEREKVLNELKEEIRRSAEIERIKSDNASLSLSLIPLAERQYKVQDFEGALATYHQALKLDPQNIVIYYRLGYVYTQDNRLDEATVHLEKALSMDADFPPALATLGYVKRRKAEAMEPNEVNRGETLAEAEQLLRRALKASPKLVDEDGESWWGSLGGLHRRRGQIDDAIDAYLKALEVTPQASYPLGNLALLYMQKRDRKRMLETYERAEVVALRRTIADPTDFWAHADLLVARVALNRRDAAEEAFKALIAATPFDSVSQMESPLKTLRQLREAMGMDGLHIQPFIEKVDSYILRQSSVSNNQQLV